VYNIFSGDNILILTSFIFSVGVSYGFAVYFIYSVGTINGTLLFYNTNYVFVELGTYPGRDVALRGFFGGAPEGDQRRLIAFKMSLDSESNSASNSTSLLKI